MNKIIYHTDPYGEEHIIIDRDNGEFTSMPKSVYDAQTAQLQTSVPQTGGTN